MTCRAARGNGIAARHRRAGHTLLHVGATEIAIWALAALYTGLALSPASCSGRCACRHAARCWLCRGRRWQRRCRGRQGSYRGRWNGCVGLLSAAVAPPCALARPVCHRTPIAAAVAVRVTTEVGACLPCVSPLLPASASLGCRPHSCDRRCLRWRRCWRGCPGRAPGRVADLGLASFKAFHSREHHLCIVALHVGSVLAERIPRAITANVDPPGILRAANLRDTLPDHSREVANGTTA